jgi:prepilin-type N-terminal cleavage/methylation domain-containing protein
LKNSIQTVQARRSQQGFTLIEIAIVLVIIRLLVGGVM